jgi:two-component system NarL family response regulator
MEKRSTKSPIRLLTVDDHPVVRAGLCSMLGKQPGLKLLGAAASAEEAVALLERYPADVILLDLRMPKMNGIEALSLFRKLQPAPHVIILSSFELEEEIYRAVQAGARGYLLKETSRDEMVAAIVAVHAGRQYFPPEIASKLSDRTHRSALSARASWKSWRCFRGDSPIRKSGGLSRSASIRFEITLTTSTRNLRFAIARKLLRSP